MGSSTAEHNTISDPPGPSLENQRPQTYYCGLRNQGATCYLNAVLQTLFMTEEFRKAVMELKHNGKEKESVSLELKNIFECLGSNSENVTTCGMTKALNIRNVHEQQDAAEYYQKILSEIEPETATIFQGKTKHTNICLCGNHEHFTENSFFSLAIAVDPNQCVKTNVQQSFNEQFEEVLMSGEDQLFCEKCENKTDMKMKCTIPKLPDVLTLHLQRFYFDFNYTTYRKNNNPVEIPLQLSAQEESGVHHIYDLYALVHHIGSLKSGHYYADIKSSEDQQWYQFNDFKVQKIQKRYDVRHSENSIVSDAACLLFFRKCSGCPQDTFSEVSESDTVRYSECRSPQTTSTDIQIRTISCVQPHQHTGHTDGPDETHRYSRSTARDDEDQQNLLNKPCQTPTDDSAADRVENYTRNYSESETETGRALFADRKVPRRRFLEECPSTRKIVCVGLIILSLVFVLIFILVFNL